MISETIEKAKKMKVLYETKVTRLNQSIADLHSSLRSEESTSTSLDAEEEDLSVECADCLFKCPAKKAFVCVSAHCSTKRSIVIGGGGPPSTNTDTIQVRTCPHVCGFCAVMQHSDSGQHRLETRKNWPPTDQNLERAIANVKKYERDVQQLRGIAAVEAGPVGYLLEMVGRR